LIDFHSQTRHIQLLKDGNSRKGLISEGVNKEKAFFRKARIFREGTTGKTGYTKWLET
jgi:hypothetical protein